MTVAARWDVVARETLEIPYRPEFVVLFTPDGCPLPLVPWAEPPMSELEARPGEELAPPEYEYTGTLLNDAEWPDDLRANMGVLDERLCKRYGFSVLNLEKVELPTIDSSDPGPLMMRVTIRRFQHEIDAGTWTP